MYLCHSSSLFINHILLFLVSHGSCSCLNTCRIFLWRVSGSLEFYWREKEAFHSPGNSYLIPGMSDFFLTHKWMSCSVPLLFLETLWWEFFPLSLPVRWESQESAAGWRLPWEVVFKQFMISFTHSWRMPSSVSQDQRRLLGLHAVLRETVSSG